MKLVEEIKLQEQLRKQVITEDCFESIEWIAGCDTSSNRFSSLIHAGVVLCGRDWQKTDEAFVSETTPLPYIPGFLAFREVPSITKALERLARKPDILFVDGHGISHPRGLGIASHLGVCLDIPTIGIGKSILIGKPATALGSQPGDTTDLIWKGQQVGLLLRTKKKCNPLIISAGHKISLPTALNLVLESLKGYRLPEPTRYAHKAANQARLTYSEIKR